MFIKSCLFVVVCVLGLAACQTTAPKIGKGPITLSTSRLGMFEYYKRQDSPSYFAMAHDGKGSGYSQCPPTNVSCSDDGGDLAISACNRGAKKRGTECSIFAIKKKTVWRGPIRYGSSNSEYSVVVSQSDFTGNARISVGVAKKFDNGNKLRVKFTTCTGEFDLSAKNWSIKGCGKKHDVTASGTIEPGIGGRIYYGFGNDNKGNDIVVNVYDPAAYQRSAKTQKEDQLPPETTPVKISPKAATPVQPSTKIPKEATATKPLDKSIKARLEKLRGLLKNGLITEDDAATKRQEILEGL
jgi:hypothetical protein